MKHSKSKSREQFRKKSRALRHWLIASAGVFVLTACSDPVPLKVGVNTEPTAQLQIEAAQAAEQEIEFQFDFSALLIKETKTAASNKKTTKVLSPDIMVGQMTIENIDTGESEIRPWSIYIDDNSFPNAESVASLAVKPGRYTFSLP